LLECSAEIILIINYLITESEVVTGKSQTEALPYWPSDSEDNTVGRGLRFSGNDRTVEVIKLFIIWLMNKGKKLFERKSSIYIRRCARLPIHSSSQTQGRTTQSVNFTTISLIPLKTLISLPEKWLPQPQKGILVSWYHKLMGKFFRLLWRNVNAYRKDSKCFKIVQTNGLSVKENTNASECTAQNKLNSVFAFAFDNISSPSSFWDLWMNFSSLVNVCSYQKHCYWQKRRPIVYMRWYWKLIYTCLCKSEGIYLMRSLTEFNTSVIVVTKMITYKFLRSVLLRMNDRSADGVLHLAILALLKTRQTLNVFHYCPLRLPAGKSSI